MPAGRRREPGHGRVCLVCRADDAGLHLARVRARVARGGHDIPEAAIRRRFEHSRFNLILLLPVLVSLRIYDNSFDADPAAGAAPKPVLVLHRVRGRIFNPRDLPRVPDWARPIAAGGARRRSGRSWWKSGSALQILKMQKNGL